MKKYQKIIASVALNIGIILNSSLALAAPQLVEKVAAIVNKDVVLETDINRTIASIKMNVEDSSQLPPVEELRKQIMDRLILESLILQEAARMGITVSDRALDEQTEAIAKENNMTVDQLRGNLAAVGITYLSYRAQIKKQMLMEEVRNIVVRDRVNILPQEVEMLIKHMKDDPDSNYEINLSQILIALPEEPSLAELKKAQATAQKVMAQLNRRSSFAAMAATYSAAPNALEGGAMGWKRPNELPTVFIEQLDLQKEKKGQIVGPIRSGVGFHILKINDFRGAKKQIPQNIKATEVLARHILLKNTILTTDEELVSKLKALKQEIIDGKTSFESAATSYSEDPGSAVNGGDLGWNLPERYDANFRNALISLKPNDISEPVKSAFGWHLIQLVDKREIDRTETALKDQAYRMIFNKKFAEEVQNWMQELRAGAYINIIDGQKPEGENNENDENKADNSDIN